MDQQKVISACSILANQWSSIAGPKNRERRRDALAALLGRKVPFKEATNSEVWKEIYRNFGLLKVSQKECQAVTEALAWSVIHAVALKRKIPEIVTNRFGTWRLQPDFSWE